MHILKCIAKWVSEWAIGVFGGERVWASGRNHSYKVGMIWFLWESTCQSTHTYSMNRQVQAAHHSRGRMKFLYGSWATCFGAGGGESCNFNSERQHGRTHLYCFSRLLSYCISLKIPKTSQSTCMPASAAHTLALIFLDVASLVGFVFLLALYEGFLEEIGIWQVIRLAAGKRRMESWKSLLSLLANRIARVCGSPPGTSLTSIAVFHTQLRSLPTLGESFMSGTTIFPVSSCLSPTSMDLENEGHTPMISADLQGFISPHDKSCIAIPGLEQLHISRTPLLPLPALAIESEQLRPHLEGLFHILFVGLYIYFLQVIHHRLEFSIRVEVLCTAVSKCLLCGWVSL